MGIHTFSLAHWQSGDRIEVSAHDPADNGQRELVWVDLEAQSGTATGTIARTGDPNYAGAPSWSHDGNDDRRTSRPTPTATDASTTAPPTSGRCPTTQGGRQRGTPLPGASANGMRNFYPSFSPDDKLRRLRRGHVGQHVQQRPPTSSTSCPPRAARRPASRRTTRPRARGKTSPGVTNSWPKWAPTPGTTPDGRTFYWVVFSSIRDPGGNPQLYVTPVVVDGAGKVTTYHALYLWNQPADENNHTPAWDNFQIPRPLRSSHSADAAASGIVRAVRGQRHGEDGAPLGAVAPRERSALLLDDGPRQPEPEARAPVRSRAS